MQLVVPSAVAIAVRMLISICTAHFTVSFFITIRDPLPTSPSMGRSAMRSRDFSMVYIVVKTPSP